MSDIFPGKSILKQRDALSSLIFNFAFIYVIRNIQGKQKGLKLNGTHQLPVYAYNIWWEA